jgi:glucose/mannose-6-phosphate isomerase
MWADAAAMATRVRAALGAARGAFGAHAWEVDTGDPVRAVAALGLGGGALAAEAAGAVAVPHLDIPLWVGTGVPAFVGPETLVFGVSCGDGTRAPAAWLSEALVRGARVAAVGEPGLLAALPVDAGAPLCQLQATEGPLGGAGTFGSAVVSLLVALARVGLSSDVAASVDAASELLQRRHDTLAAPGGSAEVLARRIGRTIPLVYGANGIGGVAAHWWKARINRNAKSPAFCARLPDLAHDELAGWGQGGDITRQAMTLLLLRERGEPAETSALFDAVTAATDEVMADVIEVWAEGEDDLSRFFDLALHAELVSLHLAAREGVDPGPVPAVDDARGWSDAAIR